jgi:arabinofuranosyltransferase
MFRQGETMLNNAASYINNRSFNLSLFIFTLVVFVYVLIMNAWVVDDAYITFRTVENFVNGYGLTWNIDERVQTYTHPLWMFIMSFFYVFTSDVFYTSIVVSFLISLLTIIIVSSFLTQRFRVKLWKLPLFIIALISSKAFIDYTSSGLENPLSYLIAALFYIKFVNTKNNIKDLDLKDLAEMFFLASIAYLNRPDTILFYLPVLIYLIIIHFPTFKWKLIRMVLLATLPASLWILFSLFYYGFPFANTVYAKVISTGFPFTWKAIRGLQYLGNSIFWDSASYIMLIFASILCIKTRSIRACIFFAGVLLYVLFVVLQAASATHMSGRFFALPFFIIIFILVERLDIRRIGFFITVVLILYITWSPVSAIKCGTSAYRSYPQNDNYIDTQWYVHNEGSALINWKPGKKLPDHEWYHYGEEVRKSPHKVHIGGAFGGEAIGYIGFAAGPAKFIVDRVGLGDPLLSKMPAIRPSRMKEWKSGHFHRMIPEGYIESVAFGRNLIKDKNINLYYNKILNITRGSLFSMSRFKDILNINIGKYNYLITNSPE